MSNSASTKRRCKAVKPAPAPIADPGRAAFCAILPHSSARFEVGEKVYSYRVEDWARRRIVKPFGVQVVFDIDGAFVADNGERFDYRYGYVVQRSDGDQGFMTAGELLNEDGKQCHLRLACVDGKAVA